MISLQKTKSMPSSARIPSNFLAISLLVLTAAASRLLPHPPNFTPLGAMALLGAASLRSFPLALIVPLAALYLSDLVLNNVVYAQYFDGFTWGIGSATYLGFFGVLLLGWFFLRGQKFSVLQLGKVTLASTLLFYFVSNFIVWYAAPLSIYPNNFAGLLACYAAALPFLLNSFLGDFFYAALLFGAYHWYESRQVAKA